MSSDNTTREVHAAETLDVLEVTSRALIPDMDHDIDPESLKNEKICVVLQAQETDAVIQDVVREELAEQVAYLKQLRVKAADGDLAAKSIITDKIVIALDKISKLTTQRTKETKDKGGGVVDFHSDAFQAVLALLTNKILAAVKETGMNESTSQRFYLKLKGQLTGFEDEAAVVYSGSGIQDKKMAAVNKARYEKV